MTLKNILVAIDFSEASPATLAYARELAHAFGGTLHVLHISWNVLATAVGVDGYTTDFTRLQHEIEETARKQLDAIVTDDDRRMLDARAVVQTSNEPAQAIVAYAKDAHIDLVVVGTHGHSRMAHLLMGSVAERVVRTAPCPVLAVRPPAVTAAAAETRGMAARAS